MAIRFSGFKKTGNIYYTPGTPPQKIATLQKLQTAAENTVRKFWGSSASLDYVFVYCNTIRDFDRYGVAGAPAATQLKGGAYVIIQEQSLDKDIIAHEISHTVLYRNIGWYKTKFKIPTWFDEGLAMQVDNRDYYSIDTLMEKRKRGIVLPDVQQLGKPAKFFAGDTEMVMLHFSTAKFVVNNWLMTHSLKNFIIAINKGLPFEEAYSKK